MKGLIADIWSLGYDVKVITTYCLSSDFFTMRTEAHLTERGKAKGYIKEFIATKGHQFSNEDIIHRVAKQDLLAIKNYIIKNGKS